MGTREHAIFMPIQDLIGIINGGFKIPSQDCEYKGGTSQCSQPKVGTTCQQDYLWGVSGKRGTLFGGSFVQDYAVQLR